MDIAAQFESTDHALTVPEVAKLLGFSRSALYEMAAECRIPHHRLGASIRFDPQELADWWRSRLMKAA
jgi:excisionase family DNA binding protein